MKKILFFFCYLLGALIGAMLLIFNAETLDRDPTILNYTMIAAGVIFLIPALFQLISSLSPKKDEFGNILPRKWYATIVAILALLWGIYILIMPMGYKETLSVTLGVSLVLVGIAQAIWIVRTSESTILRFIIPILTVAIGLGICIFVNHDMDNGKGNQISAIIAGVTLVVWAVNGFMSLRSKRVVAAADKAAKVERKAEKEERKELKHASAQKVAEAETEKKSKSLSDNVSEAMTDKPVPAPESEEKKEENVEKKGKVADSDNNN
ncbi:MAG: hypothetical protein K2N05_02855 [Muribaculaceae bacterium]|nr:hypothetical protein [Muribaculaceae bacterium]